jgi:hypothetical protein
VGHPRGSESNKSINRKGLRVSFAPTEEIEKEEERYLPVGWVWNANVPTPMAMCKMVCVKDNPGDTMHYSQHQSDEDKK